MFLSILNENNLCTLIDFSIKVTDVCNGQHPTIADGLILQLSFLLILNYPLQCSIIRVDNVLMVQEDQVYTVVGSLSNLDGTFGENSTATLF